MSLSLQSGVLAKDFSTSFINLQKNDLQAEIIEFLSTDLIKNTLIIGLILETGLETLINRNNFFYHLDHFGELDGVAIIGKKNLFYCTTDEALKYFAKIASGISGRSLVLCEKNKSESFFGYLADFGKKVKHHCQENLMITSKSKITLPTTNNLRLATYDDLELISKANAEIVESERGYNPLKNYPDEFTQSMYKLIKDEKSLVWIENNSLVCKVDVVIKTEKIIYLEGIYVSPNSRGKGIGYACIKEIKEKFLTKDNFLTLLVNTENIKARQLYHKLDFRDYCEFTFSSLVAE